jgi:hypothetical protein
MPAAIDRKAAAGLSLALVAIFALGACDSPPRDEPDEEEARALGRDTDETVFDDLVQTQDKARAVEDVTMQHKSDMDAAIDQASDAADGTEH